MPEKKVALARLAPHECSNALAHTTRMRPDLNRDCATLLPIEITPPLFTNELEVSTIRKQQYNLLKVLH